MSIRATCFWCNARNDITKARMNNLPIYCRRCGHRADVSQRRCDCPQCLHPAEALPESKPQQESLFSEESS